MRTLILACCLFFPCRLFAQPINSFDSPPPPIECKKGDYRCENIKIFASRNPQELRKEYEPRCKSGEAQACLVVARLDERDGNIPGALRYYLMACEQGKNQWGCKSAGMIYEKQNDITNAKKFYSLACDLDTIHGPGCFEHANIVEAEGNHEEALKLYESACRRGAEKSCQVIRRKRAEKELLAYASTIKCKSSKDCQPPTSIKEADSVLQQACDKKDAEVCLKLSAWFREFDQNKSRFEALSRSACSVGKGRGCWQVAGLMRDPEDRLKWYNNACKTIASGCTSAAIIYKERGEYPVALSLLEKACAMDKKSCDGLKTIKRELKESEVLLSPDHPLQKKCSEGELESCERLGELLALRRFKEAKPILQNSCDKGSMKSCRMVGEFSARQGNWAEAEAPLKKSCDAKEMIGCYWLGNLKIAKKLPEEGQALKKEACAKLFSYHECVSDHGSNGPQLQFY